MANNDKSLQAAILEVLEEERAERGIGYRTLAERTGINTGTLSKIFSGETSTLRIERLDELCTGLGINILDVMARAKQRTK